MQPRDHDLKNLALYAPRFAYALVIGVPRVPFVGDIVLQFSSSAVNAVPIVQSFSNNLTQDTLIERVSFDLDQQNSFAGSPFQALALNQAKQLGSTGVGIQMAVYGGPKYNVNDQFTDLGNLADVFAVAWPQGWPLFKQSNIKVSAILTKTPVSVPYDVTITFLGWQFLDKAIDDMDDDEARNRLRILFPSWDIPDLSKIAR